MTGTTVQGRRDVGWVLTVPWEERRVGGLKINFLLLKGLTMVIRHLRTTAQTSPERIKYLRCQNFSSDDRSKGQDRGTFQCASTFIKRPSPLSGLTAHGSAKGTTGTFCRPPVDRRLRAEPQVDPELIRATSRPLGPFFCPRVERDTWAPTGRATVPWRAGRPGVCGRSPRALGPLGAPGTPLARAVGAGPAVLKRTRMRGGKKR